MSDRIDMSAFEAQFEDEPRYSKVMPNAEFERLAFLNERILDLTEFIDLRNLTNEELQVKLAYYNAIIKRIDAIRKKFTAKRDPIEATITWNKRHNREDTRLRDDLERERRRLLDEIAARERLLARKGLLISSTANKPWAVGVEVNGKIKKALPHQLDGAHRLVAAERGILGDKPGLGKTLESIMTIDMLRAEGKGQKVLIFTPKSVVPDYERSFKQWTDPTLVFSLNQTLKGIKTEILSMVEHIPEIILITNYEVWRKDRSIHEKLIACGFDTVILDEAHALKDFDSKTAQDIRAIIYAENKCPRCGHGRFVSRGLFGKMCAACEYEQEEDGDFCSVKNVYPMTGTPMLNKPDDLFSLLNLLDRKAFPDKNAFLRDYCYKTYDYRTEKYVYTFGDGGSERLLKKLGLRYTARDRDTAGVVMPPQEVKHHWLELDPEKYPKQHAFIEQLRERARLAFAPGVELSQPAILAWYTRMRQSASWPDAIQIKGCGHNPPCEDEWGNPGECFNPTIIFPPPGTPPIGESIIMDTAEDIVCEAVEDGDRIIVFSHFRGVIAELERRCKAHNLRVGIITGDVPQSKRQEYIDDFNVNYTKVGEHKYDVLICQYKTASVGLNLSGAAQSLMIEREWNPGKEEQAMDRNRRLDSELDTIVHVLHCAGTATELIDALQEQKSAMIEGFEADVNLMEAMRKFLEG